ncbi:MAG: hypothetical protein ACOYLQ_08285 [Hyphomicrobiaceae bacterium]
MRATWGPRRTAILLALTILAADPVAADGLRLATFNLAAGQPAPEPAPAAPAAPQASPAPTFRHTFGAERRPEQHRLKASDTSGIAADAYLLQGISDAAAIRRLFPAAAWTIVLSRQLIDRTRQEPLATTGIVVRHSETARVVQREHFLPLRGSAPAATAVQLRHGASLVWLVSIDLDRTCITATAGPSPASCAGVATLADALATWIGQKLADGQPVVLGGPATPDLRSRLSRSGPPRAQQRPPAPRSTPPAASGAAETATAVAADGALLVPTVDGPCKASKGGEGLLIADPTGTLAIADRGYAIPNGGGARTGGGCILVLDYADTRAAAAPMDGVTRADRR